MKAKDTVKTSGELCLMVCQEYRTKNSNCKPCDGLDCEVCQLEKQAELSFKDGIKEVVDWLNKNPIYVYSKKLDNTIPLNTSPEWEHQIKEWGIEDK